MLNEILKVLNTLVGTGLAIGAGYVFSKGLNFAASHTKNNNIKKALIFASQAVLTAQELLGNGKVQQKNAAYDLKKRLDENGIGDKFTEAQILAYIKQAYAVNKANGSLSAVKPIVSEDELYEAERVVNVSNDTETTTAAQ